MNKKLNFVTVFALVVGSQVGTGAFIFPSTLAKFGIYSLLGWFIAILGAISLALVFAFLCAKFPRTGGPHVYIQKAFGQTPAFFIGFAYWIVSWVSSAAVVATGVAALSEIFTNLSLYNYVAIEIFMLTAITWLNLKGVYLVGRVEVFLNFFKFLPLTILPFFAIFHFDISNFVIDSSVIEQSPQIIIREIVLIALWGFVGLESATASAENVENANKTIPRAIILGTIFTGVIYFFNSLSILGMINGSELINISSPYTEVSNRLFGSYWHLAISFIIFMVCAGTLNAWTMISGQIILGLAKDGLVPAIFSYKNKNNIPSFALIISGIGIAILIFLTANENFASQVNMVIDFSVTIFIFIYLLCSLAFMKILIKEKNYNFTKWFISLFGALFCIFVLKETSLKSFLISGLFVFSGAPIYFLWYRKNRVLKV